MHSYTQSSQRVGIMCEIKKKNNNNRCIKYVCIMFIYYLTKQKSSSGN